MDMDETTIGVYPRADRNLIAGQRRKRGTERKQETAADASIRRGAQRQAAESGM